MSSKSYQDFESKKTIHFTLTREAHAGLRIACFKARLSMQEVFEEVAQRIAAESPEMIKLLGELSDYKKHKIIKKLSDTDAESLFNIIEQESPLTDD
tara:strand:+ start:2437 stop:2727 length:291 start_codon:yes stop_codon:yes gene_type:complete